MTEGVNPPAEISAEALRKAEEYVQQEEGAANRLSGWVGITVTAIAVAMTLFHLYAAYDIVPTIPLRYTHVAFVLLLSFLLFPVANRFRNRIMWFDVIPPLLGIVVGAAPLPIVGGTMPNVGLATIAAKSPTGCSRLTSTIRSPSARMPTDATSPVPLR